MLEGNQLMNYQSQNQQDDYKQQPIDKEEETEV